MILLPDGTVMAANSNTSSTWYRLTPDAQGHYVNGTWTTLQSMHDTRLYYSSQVLKDGRLFVAGGEYGIGKKTGETYDPLTNTWKMAPPPGHAFSDSNSEILPDGRVLVALVEGSLRGTILFDPTANTWALGPTCLGIHNESAWIKLPDESILQVDRNTTNSERYIPSTNQWIADATVPVSLFDPYGLETGAALLLPNGKVFHIGSLGHNATYTPSGSTTNGAWTAAIDLPNSTGQPDGPAAMLPNGKILCAVSPVPTSANHFPSPTTFYEYDYTTNSFASVATPSGSTLNHACYFGTMLVLPDGTVLYSDFANKIYSYQFDGSPIAAGKPTITSIVQNADASFHLTGTLLNGLTEGSSYGDDNQNNTNYPIVRLTSSGGGTVYYARTTNWSSTGVATGSTPQTTEFFLPAGLPADTYSVSVIANGISSDPVSLDVLPILVSLTAATTTEGAAPVNGTVTLPSAPVADTDITLTSSATSRATVPATVTVPAGQTSASFQLTVVDDALLNGALSSVVSASASGYQSGSTLFVTKDNETSILSVTPVSSFSSSGPYGGPFSVSSVTYTLTNNGNTSLNWTAAKAATWFTLSSTSGTLAAGATATVTASLAASTTTLAPSSNTDTVIFLNTTTGDGDTSRSASLTVSKASPTFSTLTASPTITYGTASVTLSGKLAAASGVAPPSGSTVSVTINGATSTTTTTNTTGNFSLSFNTSAIPVSVSAYTISYSYAGNTNFNSSTNTSTTLTVNKAAPAFANLTTSQSVAYGSASINLSGKIAAGALSPPTTEAVSITINGTSVTPTIGSGGNFSATYDTHATLPSTYTIAYSYAGDSNFTSAADNSTTLTVTGAPSMGLSATGLDSSGFIGGPFSPASNVITVTNSGTSPLNWTAAKTQTWVTLSSTGGTLPPAGSVDVTVSINAGANALVVGTYGDTVTFTNTNNGVGTATRAVTLAVNPLIPVLSVTPTGGLSSAGDYGGPFTPAIKDFTLTNAGNGPMNWTAGKTAGWLTLSATSGTLGIGATTIVTATINASAATLDPASYSDTITFSNTSNANGDTTRSVSLTVNPRPVLSLTPATAMISSGSYGGPFTPATMNFTVSNTGAGPMNWTAVKNVAWLTLSAAGGTIAAGSSVVITATIDASAAALPPGIHTDSISFTNTSNSLGNAARGVSLSIIPAPPVLALPSSFTKGSSHTVSWPGVLGATDYDVQIASDAGFTSPLATQNSANASATFGTLSSGGTYYYRARTNTGALSSAWSGVVSSTQDAGVPTVSIITPATGSSTTHPSITIQGTAADSISGLSAVTVNGQAATSNDGLAHWSATVPLSNGSNTLTVTATDNAQSGGNSATAAVTVNYAPSTVSDGLPDAWKVSHGLDPNSTDPVNGLLGDSDHDGIPNLLEYAFNSDPHAQDANPSSFSTQTNPEDGQRYFTISYPRRIGALDLTYSIEVSDSLLLWSTPPGVVEIVSVVPVGDGVMEIVTARILAPTGMTAHKFIRVHVDVN